MTNQTNQNADGPGEADQAEELITTIRSSLREGGPQVHAALLVGFIDKSLAPDDMVKVDRLIRTWRNWNFEYCNLLAANLGTDTDDQITQEDPLITIDDFRHRVHHRLDGEQS